MCVSVLLKIPQESLQVPGSLVRCWVLPSQAASQAKQQRQLPSRSHGPSCRSGSVARAARGHFRLDPCCDSPEVRVSGGALKDGNEQGDDKSVWVRASGPTSMGALPRKAGMGRTSLLLMTTAGS